MINSYKKLYKSSGTLIAGCIEDSRGTRFCELLAQQHPNMKTILQKTKDTNLLAFALRPGERTPTFNYASDPTNHPILSEFSQAKNIRTFYLGASEDRPLRIDFLGKESDADKIASTILALTVHPSYSIPSILIEADNRAKLSHQDLEFFYHDLLTRTGELPALLQKRRDKRPF
jgi:hypothetical protein